MGMAQCIYDEGVAYKVKSIIDAGLYDLCGDDCIRGGTYNEFAETHTSTSLTLDIASGVGYVVGAYFELPNAVQIELNANSENYIVARIDKTRPNGEKARIEAITEVQIKREQLNGNGVIADLLLYKVDTDANGVVSVIDLRKIKNGHTLYINELTIAGTPIALSESEEWDLDGTYTHYLDIQVIGVYDTDYLSNYVFRSDFEGASVVRTLQNKLRFYFTSDAEVNSKAFDLTIVGR